MPNLIDSAAFSANEIYELQQTDQVEGAAIGASFNGVGISNQPHQQLANRSAFLKARQDTNIANIGVLQAFQALFTGSLQPGGSYITIPFVDITRGLIQGLLQFGLIDFGSSQNEGLFGPYSFPVPFSAPPFLFAPISLTPEPPNGAGDNVIMVSSSNRPTARQFWVMNNRVSTGGDASRGFYWLALGF